MNPTRRTFPPTWPPLPPGWATRAIRRLCQPPLPPGGQCPGGPKKSPPGRPCPTPTPPPPVRPPFPPCPSLRRLISPFRPIFSPLFRPAPQEKYSPGPDNPRGDRVIDTDHRQIGEDEPETVYKIIRWDYDGKGSEHSPDVRIQNLKDLCSKALQQRKGNAKLECTIDPETQGLTEEQTEIWNKEKAKQTDETPL